VCSNPATKKKRRIDSMKETKYIEDREDRIYEGICKAERAFAMTTIILDYGFDSPELSKDEISTLKARSNEIGQIIFGIRDYLLEIQDLLEKLQYEELPKQEMTFEDVTDGDTPFEDTTAQKVVNSDLSSTEYFRKRHGAMTDLLKAHSLISTLQKNYMLDCSELDYEDLQKIKADCGEIATMLSMTDDFVCNVLELVRGEQNERK
jgi:hypothetical protein